MRTPLSRVGSRSKKTFRCGPKSRIINFDQRVRFTQDGVNISGWPSRGGVIILNDATHVDFIFLDLSTTDPPVARQFRPPATLAKDDNKDKNNSDTRNSEGVRGELQQAGISSEDIDVDEEDVFCRRLLLLGAKWWDGYSRYFDVSKFEDEAYEEFLDSKRLKEATKRERRWVKVGWENAAVYSSVGAGGFWVLDCDVNWFGILETDNLVPGDAGRIKLAKTMDERCIILKKMGAKYYPRLEDYESDSTFLRAWEWKWKGEIGDLMKER